MTLTVAVLAFGAADIEFNSLSARQGPPTAVTRIEAAPAPAPVVDVAHVLVATADIPLGGSLSAANTEWQEWPKARVSGQMIVETPGATVDEATRTALARSPILKDEPIRRDRIVKAGSGSLLSAVLPAGKRAVTVTIEGNNGQAGQPSVAANDKVDVIKVARDDDASKAKGVDVVTSETIVENVRVLAVTATSATLELDPEQARIVILAQRPFPGGLHLALRSLADSDGDSTTNRSAEGPVGVTVIRFSPAGYTVTVHSTDHLASMQKQ